MKSDMENNEWADEEMSLKQVNKNNPFTVPVGYFEASAQRILSLAKLEELKTDHPAQGFTVPVNYFDELPAHINSRISIRDMIDAGPPGFTIPDDYFEGLTNKIQSRINIEAAVNAEHTGFTVPHNYFENLGQHINSRLTVEDALENNAGSFSVPDNYFEELNKNILNKTVNKDTAVRKTIVRKLFASNTFKYATAACLALVIGTSVFLKEAAAPATHSHTYLHTQLSGVPLDEIKDYLELYIDANDTHGLMDNDKQINTQDLDASLQDYIDIN